MNQFDVTIQKVEIVFYSYLNRVPLKFGHEVSNGGETVCVCTTVVGKDGRTACGYGETPLGAAWSWPSALPISDRLARMKGFCQILQEAWNEEAVCGHPMDIGHHFLECRLKDCLKKANASYPGQEEMPYLAALVCCSAFDLAL